jgi:hypothetical protein
MTDARTTFLVEENKFLRTWVRELIQEKDSLRQELLDMKDDLMFPVQLTSRVVSIPYEIEDVPF